MFRSAAFLALVLSHVAPHFQPRAEAAELLSKLGEQHDVDPLLVIADAENESRWQPDVINPVSGTVGLMQIQPMNITSCAATHEKWSPECWETRQLFEAWSTNLRVGTSYFSFARAYCREHEHTSLAVYWLQIPRGDDAVRHARCGHRNGRALKVPSAVYRLLARRAELEKMR